ncbi:MAG: polysaccharide deacetylase family protein [Solirubrobacterales bacterium]|nr:polysaccharide deacetylase family protein [Solirubrobacterales bacterium]
MDEELYRRRRVQRARERHQRAVRRRLFAGGALLALIVIVVVALTAGGGSSSPGGSSSHPRRTAATSRARRSAGRRARSHGGSTAARLARGDGRPGDATVPVLMYHVIASPPAGAPFPGLYVPASEFAAQMAELRAAGWHPVTLDQLRANWTTGARLPPGKPIVLTFDNGYHSQYAVALPVLRRLHWVADENIQLTGLPPSQGGLSEAEVRAMVRAGWELDTQGISHADLITLDAAELHAQIASSRATLRRRYHVPVNWFCYPSGHYDATVIAAVRAAGYVGSTTVVPGWATRHEDPFRLPRLRVLGGTSPQGLLQQIASTRSAAAPPASYNGT